MQAYQLSHNYSFGKLTLKSIKDLMYFTTHATQEKNIKTEQLVRPNEIANILQKITVTDLQVSSMSSLLCPINIFPLISKT